MKETAVVFAAVYAAVVSRQVLKGDRQLSVSWENRRIRARKEAHEAVAYYTEYLGNE